MRLGFIPGLGLQSGEQIPLLAFDEVFVNLENRVLETDQRLLALTGKNKHNVAHIVEVEVVGHQVPQTGVNELREVKVVLAATLDNRAFARDGALKVTLQEGHHSFVERLLVGRDVPPERVLVFVLENFFGNLNHFGEDQIDLRGVKVNHQDSGQVNEDVASVDVLVLDQMHQNEFEVASAFLVQAVQAQFSLGNARFLTDSQDVFASRCLSCSEHGVRVLLSEPKKPHEAGALEFIGDASAYLLLPLGSVFLAGRAERLHLRPLEVFQHHQLPAHVKRQLRTH